MDLFIVLSEVAYKTTEDWDKTQDIGYVPEDVVVGITCENHKEVESKRAHDGCHSEFAPMFDEDVHNSKDLEVKGDLIFSL